MLKTHAVGIDLGTTYSCIAHLNEHGEPITIPNQEGELSTPSVVMFEDGNAIVGTEALRHAIAHPEKVIQNSKRYVGSSQHVWQIDGVNYSPVDVATLILRKLLDAAADRLGTVEHAVITVPAQFSDRQRQATMEAGFKAGLKQVDIINEPVAAALCYVLGTEGLWFSELAVEQQILVYDLGGGTFDLSLVRYQKNEVQVIASGGDLQLGGIDWNLALEKALARQFYKEYGSNPLKDPESRQFLALEVEQAKRGLSVRPKTTVTCQHDGYRRSYHVLQSQFEKLTKPLVDQSEDITLRLLRDNQMGWAHVDVVLTTGGASRMPMIRQMLKRLSGRTLNTSLSPDQSIAHGATYYAGMLLTNNDFARSILNPQAAQRLSKVKQQSVNARGLGILVRDPETNARIPHYLIPANTPLPTSRTETFGTVVSGQKRVNLHVIESGTSPEKPFENLGTCTIQALPENLPVDSEIAVTISYDAQARVHVSAKDVSSGKEASTEIVRVENLITQDVERLQELADPNSEVSSPVHAKTSQAESPVSGSDVADKKTSPPPAAESLLNRAARPIPLCNECGEPLGSDGNCPNAKCPGRRAAVRRQQNSTVKRQPASPASRDRKGQPPRNPASAPRPAAKSSTRTRSAKPSGNEGEEDFWTSMETE